MSYISKLVETWLAIATEDGNLSVQSAIKELNAACDCNIDVVTLDRWCRGSDTPNAAQRAYLIEYALDRLAVDIGVSYCDNSEENHRLFAVARWIVNSLRFINVAPIKT